MGILVSKRPTLSLPRLTCVHRHTGTQFIVEAEQSTNLAGKLYREDAKPDIVLQNLAHVRQRTIAEAESATLLTSELLGQTLPIALHRVRRWIADREPRVSNALKLDVVLAEALKVGDSEAQLILLRRLPNRSAELSSQLTRHGRFAQQHVERLVIEIGKPQQLFWS